MISDPQIVITLKPKLSYWLSKYFVIIVIASLLPFFAIYWDLEMLVHYALMGLFIVVWGMLCYTYIDTLFATKWIITQDEILLYRGIFYRKVDHLELYRITDYSESQNFLQLIFQNKTVKLTSGDPSHPVLCLYGIDKKISIIEKLRKRVEIQKNKRGIYEVTNRY